MEKEKLDFTGGDHSFRNWFKIMWENRYIQIFCVSFGGFILQLLNLDWCLLRLFESYLTGFIEFVSVSCFMCLPLAISCIVAYKGFYQFWNDLKNGIRR